jgi:hypothetical protein
MENTRTHETRRSKTPGRLLICLFLIVAIAGGFTIYKYLTRPHPEVAVRQLAEAVKSGDEDAVKSNLASGNLQLLQMFGASDKLPEVLDAVRENLISRQYVEGKEYVLEVASVKKDKAVVNFKAGPTLPDSKPARVLRSLHDGIPFVVIKEGKDWKVDLVATYPSIVGPLQKQGISLGGF